MSEFCYEQELIGFLVAVLCCLPPLPSVLAPPSRVWCCGKIFASITRSYSTNAEQIQGRHIVSLLSKDFKTNMMPENHWWLHLEALHGTEVRHGGANVDTRGSAYWTKWVVRH